MSVRGAAPDEVFDQGLQHERTALAWDRTGVAILVAGALFVRAGDPPYHALRHLPGWLFIVVGAVVLVQAYRGYHRRHVVLRSGEPVATPWLLWLVGAASVAFSTASLVLVVAGG